MVGGCDCDDGEEAKWFNICRISVVAEIECDCDTDCEVIYVYLYEYLCCLQESHCRELEFKIKCLNWALSSSDNRGEDTTNCKSKFTYTLSRQRILSVVKYKKVIGNKWETISFSLTPSSTLSSLSILYPRLCLVGVCLERVHYTLYTQTYIYVVLYL